MKDAQIRWGQPPADTWRSGLTAEDIEDLQFDTLDVQAAPASTAPVVELANADEAILQSLRAKTIHLAGSRTHEVRLLQTDSAVSADPDVSKDAIIRD